MTSHVLENMQEVVTNDYSTSHKAVDVVASESKIDDVIAAGDGTVEMAVKDVEYTNHNTKGTATYGNFVKIKHPNGKKTLYAHLKYGSVNVEEGDEVAKGEKIGTIGDTGNAYGAHLHFEVRNEDETRENPNDFLNGNITLENENITTEEKEKIKEEYNEEMKDSKKIVSETINNLISENNEEVTLENNNYCGGSIVDGLKGINVDSSFDNRSLIAQKNGIQDYHGTYNQNVYLLKLLKQGKLKA